METLLLMGIGMLALGVLFLVLEAFVPSGGVLGILAGVCAVVGIVMLFKHDTTWGMIGLLGTVLLGPMAFFGALNLLPNTPLGRSMLGPSGEEIAAEKDRARHEQRRARESLLGLEGLALTDMRPGGVIELEGERYDAIARGGLIDRGGRVRVSKIDGLAIEVRAADLG